MPCVKFTTEGNQVQAEITFHSSGDVYNTAYLLDTCHRALIQTISAIWSDWIDYDQYMTGLHADIVEGTSYDPHNEFGGQTNG